MLRVSITCGLWVCAAALLLVWIAPVPVDAAGDADRPWKPLRNMRFFAGDEVDFASQIFRRGSLFLVVPSGGVETYVLSKKDQSVVAIERAAVATGDAVPTVSDDQIAAAQPVGGYEKRERGRWLVWQRGDVALSVRPKPELIGAATLAQILEEKPTYREKADAYEPDAEAVAGMRDAGDELGFVVGFGTWCPTCADWTPRFIRAFEETGLDVARLTFVTIDPELVEPAELLEQYGIESVPTFIVMRSGEELGRIDLVDLDRDPDTPIESRMLRIVNGKGL